MQNFENILNDGEKVYLKISGIRESFILMQKEDEIIFLDDSNFSDFKAYFDNDMINKQDLEYLLLMTEDHFKKNEFMLKNFLNNFVQCEMKNDVVWEDVINSLYNFLE